MIIVALLLAHFAFGLFYTYMRLADEIAYYDVTTPTVNLLRSYWYELYEPDATFKWIGENVHEPIVPIVADKVATVVYARKNGVLLINPVATDTMYVYTAYESQLTKQINAYFTCMKRLNPKMQHGNVYMVARMSE